MKTTKYIVSILILSMIIVSCRKEFPEPDNPDCNGCVLSFTNKYILTDINVQINSEKDTAKYNDFYINVDLSGSLVSENTFFKGEGHKYFINKINNIDVITNVSYNDSLLYNDNIFLLRHLTFYSYNKGRYLKERNDIYGEELGFTPLMIKINIPPDTSKWVSFTVKITDDKNNVFIASTDSLFITK